MERIYVWTSRCQHAMSFTRVNLRHVW